MVYTKLTTLVTWQWQGRKALAFLPFSGDFFQLLPSHPPSPIFKKNIETLRTPLLTRGAQNILEILKAKRNVWSLGGHDKVQKALAFYCIMAANFSHLCYSTLTSSYDWQTPFLDWKCPKGHQSHDTS